MGRAALRARPGDGQLYLSGDLALRTVQAEIGANSSGGRNR
ncbi:MAG: hypothetical protein V3S52_04650 [Gemmatimonadota bacterium]|jgi:hypothetical protein